MEPQKDLLADELLELSTKRRKELLPWWIKVFAWIFAVMAALSVPSVILALIMHTPSSFQIYGLDSYYVLSANSIIIISIFLFKGITAYGLLAKKRWAVKCAIVDAAIGIAVCFFMMIYAIVATPGWGIRLELVLLIPYLIKMLKIKDDWQGIAV